jgi:hypothetical protein
MHLWHKETRLKTGVSGKQGNTRYDFKEELEIVKKIVGTSI